jgi:hypothetical protein
MEMFIDLPEVKALIDYAPNTDYPFIDDDEAIADLATLREPAVGDHLFFGMCTHDD